MSRAVTRVASQENRCRCTTCPPAETCEPVSTAYSRLTIRLLFASLILSLLSALCVCENGLCVALIAAVGKTRSSEIASEGGK